MVLLDPNPPLAARGRSTHLQPINFLWGKPAPSLLPIAQLAQATHRLLLKDPASATDSLEYGDASGCPELREQIARLLSSFYRESRVDARNICVTAGASAAIPTILNVLTDPVVTKSVWVISPCFHLACRMFEDVGFAGKIKAVPERADGSIDTEALELAMCEIELAHNMTSAQATKSVASHRKTFAHIIYTVPTFSNPSGKIMPLACRHELVGVARRHDGLIVSDDIYDMLQWPSATSEDAPSPGSHTPARFIDLDRASSDQTTDPANFGNALSIGSFSKILAPGMRVGWVDARPALADALGQYGSSLAGGGPSSQLAQGIIVELMRNEWLEHHIRHTLVPAYRARRELMIGAIEEHLVPLGVVLESQQPDVVGGFFLWLRMPQRGSSRRIHAISVERERLTICPGADCKVASDETFLTWDNYVRLSFSYETEENLVEGIVRLARAIEASM